MTTKQLAVIESKKELTVTDVRKQVNLIQNVMKSVMEEGVHYGTIPGTNKPTLYKPGAEKLMMTFRLRAEYDELPGSIEEKDFISYKIECRLFSIETGQEVGSGRGTCNSREKKYKTRTVYANKATDEEKEIGKLEKRPAQNGGSYEVYVVPQDPWDLQNTIYKMSCKRANGAAILNTTAASDIFSQDIEDLPEGTIEPDYKKSTRKPDTQTPKSKKQTPKKSEKENHSEDKILPAEKSNIRKMLAKLDLTEEQYFTGKKLNDLLRGEASDVLKDLAEQLNDKLEKK
jgi:hypothetical protein